MADKEPKPKASSPKTEAMRALREARYLAAHEKPVKPSKTKSVPPKTPPKK